MRILDRYLLKNFILPLFYCLIVFSLLYIIVDIFGHLDEILKNKVSITILLQYYASFIPVIFVQSAPVAALLSMVYMLSALNKSNELTACKSCGISTTRLLMPVFFIGLILSLSIFLVNERVVPRSVVIANKIKTDYIETSPEKRTNLKVIKDLTVYGKKNQMIYAKEFNPLKNRLSDIIILEQDDNQFLQKKILAKEAVWDGSNWEFRKCRIYSFDKDGNPVGNTQIFDKKFLSFPETPQELLKYDMQAGYMSYRELKDYIRRLSGNNTKTIASLKTDLYFKTSVPFVCFIIMFLGIPFALSTARGGAMAGIGTSVIVGLLYYGSIYFSLALGKGQILPPIVSAHLPNILFFIIALLLIRKAPR
ncbi:LptF/LptG family permease [Candidatus Omnitrophota bacterium]